MNLSEDYIKTIADELYEAELSRVPIAPPSDSYSEMTLEDAYAIQNFNVRRCRETGNQLVGYKIGLTSVAAQKHFNLTHPDLGHLFDSMETMEEGSVERSSLIQPMVEGEIAFFMSKDLKGPGVDARAVQDAIEYVVPAIEIIDSRIKNWEIKAVDTIADNGSSALFVLGKKRSNPIGLEFPLLGMTLSEGNKVMETGAAGAVMNNPLNAVAFLANELSKQGTYLQAGQMVLSGSIGGMLSVKDKERFTVEIARLGSVQVEFI